MTDLDEQAVYDQPAAWAAGPQRVYDRLAARAVAHLGPVAGRTVLDAGAGTGGATRALRAHDTQVLACDRSPHMLRALRAQTDYRVPTVVADVRALPMADRSVDAVIACFVINHFDDPAAALREMARVTRPGGRVVATSFGEDDHPIKGVVDETLRGHGFVPPAWYTAIKTARAPLVGSIEAVAAVASTAGLRDARVSCERVDLSDVPAEAAAAYRLGMGHITPFLDAQPPAVRAAITEEVVAEVRALPPLVLPMLVLNAPIQGI